MYLVLINSQTNDRQHCINDARQPIRLLLVKKSLLSLLSLLPQKGTKHKHINCVCLLQVKASATRAFNSYSDHRTALRVFTFIAYGHRKAAHILSSSHKLNWTKLMHTFFKNKHFRRTWLIPSWCSKAILRNDKWRVHRAHIIRS